MATTPLRLYDRVPASLSNATVATLDIRVPPHVNYGAITWEVSTPDANQVRVYLLQAEVQTYGDEPWHPLDCDRWLAETRMGEAPWRWLMTPLELTKLEARRNGQDFGCTLRCTGLAQVTDEHGTRLVPIHGNTSLYIARSEWSTLLTQLNYQPAEWVRLPLESQHWPNWAQTVGQLQVAREALARGDTRTALEQCFGIFDEEDKFPYDADKDQKRNYWKGKYAIDAQKEEGLMSLLAGIADCLNKVARHPHKEVRDAQGKLTRAQIDHYEAEALVAMTTLLVAWLERLPRTSTS